LPDAPPRVVAAIDRALTRDMNERYANARAFLRALIDAAREDGVPLEDLEEVLTGMLASSPPGPRSEPPESAAAAISERATMHVHDTPPAARLARSMESKRGAAEPSPEDDAPAPRSEPSPPLDGAPRASRAP